MRSNSTPAAITRGPRSSWSAQIVTCSVVSQANRGILAAHLPVHQIRSLFLQAIPLGGGLGRLSRRAHSTATLSVVAIHSLLGSLQSERRQVPRGEGFANEAVAAQTGRFADRCRSRFPGRQSERRCPWRPANTARIGGMARAPRQRTGCDHRFTTSYAKLRVSRATRSQL